MILWEFIGVYKTKFLIPNFPDLAFWGSTELEVGRSIGQSTDVHRYMQEPWLEGRSTDQESSLSGSGPGRPAGRPARELCYLDLASVNR